MRRKIVIITGISNTLNNGCWAMAESVMSMLEKNFPDLELYYLTDARSEDEKRLSKNNRKFFYMPWTKIDIPKIRVLYAFFSAFIIFINFLLMRVFRINIFYREFSKIFAKSDLIIDLSGDSISRDYNDYSVFLQILPLIFALIINKKYMLYAQSIGPFKKNVLYKVVKHVLKKSSLITARENITVSILKKAGINKNVKLTADSAFLLQPDNNINFILKKFDIVFERNKYAAVSISYLLCRYFNDPRLNSSSFFGTLARILDEIVEKYNIYIIFVPHVMIGEINDLHASFEVFRKMEHRDKTVIITEKYNGAQLKAIIGKCEFIIASRMHAAIAAFSQYVPVLIFSYNHKTHGIIGNMLKMPECIIDVRKIEVEVFEKKLREKVEYLVKNLNSLKEKLKDSVEVLKEKTMENFYYCKELLYG